MCVFERNDLWSIWLDGSFVLTLRVRKSRSWVKSKFIDTEGENVAKVVCATSVSSYLPTEGDGRLRFRRRRYVGRYNRYIGIYVF